MLERAKTCIESGERLLRASRGASRHNSKTKRAIHYAFWQPSHGFETLLASLGSSHGTAESACEASATKDDEASPSAFMLDFLYPAKTMAFMQRMSLLGWDQWNPYDATKAISRSRRAWFSSSRRLGYKHTVLDVEEKDSTRDAIKPLPPGTRGNPRKALEELLNSERRDEHALVWALYTHLEPPDSRPSEELQTHTDDRLTPAVKSKVLTYLSRSTERTDNMRGVAVFDSIPEADRCSSDFAALIAIRLRQGLVGEALSVHERALRTVTEDGFGTDMLIERLVEGRQWAYLWQTYSRYLEVSSHIPNFKRKDIFARLRTAGPRVNIVAKFLDYLDEYRGQHAATGTLEKLHELIVAVIETSLPSLKYTQRWHVLSLFRRLRASGLLAAHHYETAMQHLLNILQFDKSKVNSMSSHLVFQLYKEWVADAKSGKIKHVPDFRLMQRVFWGYYECTRNFEQRERLLQRAQDGSVILEFSNVSARSLLADIRHFHKHPSANTLYRAMHLYANLGFPKKTLLLFKEYLGTKPGIRDAGHFHPLLYAFALARDERGAQAQFDRIFSEFSVEPDIQCWNTLIYAYTRSGDPDSAVTCLRRMIDMGHDPDLYSYHPIVASFADYGDLAAVQRLFEEMTFFGIDTKGTNFQSSLITAQIRSHDVDAAVATLTANLAMHENRSHLAPLVNPLLAHYAKEGRLETVQTLYRKMRQDGIEFDSYTWATIIKALSNVHQSNAAYKIVRKVMPKTGILPQGYHFGLVMTGFNAQHEYDRIDEIQQYMKSVGVRPTYHTHIASLIAEYQLGKMDVDARAKGIVAALPHASKRLRKRMLESPEDRLQGFIQGLRKAMKTDQTALIAVRQPRLFSTSYSRHSPAQGAEAEMLVQVYGLQGSLEMVRQLLAEYLPTQQFLGNRDFDVSLQVLAALMRIYMSVDDHDGVLQCWSLLKQQADKVSVQFSIPLGRQWMLEQDGIADFLTDPSLEPYKAGNAADNPKVSRPPNTDTTYVSGDLRSTSNVSPPPPSMPSADDNTTSTTSTSDPTPPKLRILPAHAQFLQHFLPIYLRSLLSQNAYPRICTEIELLVGQGYAPSESTWNLYVTALVHASRPIEAFQVAESLLMRDFPGWLDDDLTWRDQPKPYYTPNEYRWMATNARRDFRRQLMRPRTDMLIVLASVLRVLQRDVAEEAQVMLGSLREAAPRVVRAVEQMPVVTTDEMQQRYLGVT